MTQKRLGGIVPALVTPLTASGADVDVDAARKLVRFLIAKKVNGLFALGSTGECGVLDIELRKKMAEVVIEEARGELPVVVHVGAPRESEVHHLAAHAVSAGADGIALVPPYYYGMDEAALEQFFTRVAHSVDLPIYLYNIPSNAKNVITVRLFIRLATAHEHIVGMKDSSMDFASYYELVQCKQPDHIALIGNDAQILAALAVGGQGAVSAGATAIPEPFVRLMAAFAKQDLVEARKWQSICARIRRMFVRPWPIAPLKMVLHWRGICDSTVAAPLRQMTSEETRELKNEFEQIMESLECGGDGGNTGLRDTGRG